MLLAKLDQQGHEGKAIFQERVQRAYRGDWLGLLRDARRSAPLRVGARPSARPRQEAHARDFDAWFADAVGATRNDEESLFASVVQKVRRGELSRAAKQLVASPVAPGTPETLAKLTDPRRRPT